MGSSVVAATEGPEVTLGEEVQEAPSSVEEKTRAGRHDSGSKKVKQETRAVGALGHG